MSSLSQKVAIITGGSSGIGKALALNLLNQGCKVAVCARNLQKLQDSFFDVSDEKLLLMQVDVSDEKACEGFVTATVAKFGTVDILINNAGMSMRAMFADVEIKVLKELMDINFWGTVYMTKYSLPHILQQHGTLVGISSIAGYRGLPARTGYSASKFAMYGFLSAVRTEVFRKRVNVLIASPHFTASNIRNTSLRADGTAQQDTPMDEDKLMSAEECAAIIIKGIKKRKRTIIMTTQGKLTVLFSRWFPNWMDNMVYKHFSREPNSPLK